MKFSLSIIFTLFLVLLSVLSVFGGDQKAAKHSDVDWTISCRDCHSDVTPEITKQWKNSAHGVVTFGCYMCHGDGQEEFSPKPSSDNCISCHSDQEIDFSKIQANSCFDCHNGHTLKFHQK